MKIIGKIIPILAESLHIKSPLNKHLEKWMYAISELGKRLAHSCSARAQEVGGKSQCTQGCSLYTSAAEIWCKWGSGGDSLDWAIFLISSLALLFRLTVMSLTSHSHRECIWGEEATALIKSNNHLRKQGSGPLTATRREMWRSPRSRLEIDLQPRCLCLCDEQGIACYVSPERVFFPK